MTHDRGVSFHTHVPPPALRPFVASAYGYRVPAYPTGLHRGLPSRHLTLVVELLAPLRVSVAGGSVAAHAVIGGLSISPALIDASRPQEGLQYALTPAGGAALLGVPAGELGGHTLDLADLVGTRGDRLVDRIRAAPGWSARFRLLDTALLGWLGTATADVLPDVSEAWRVIFATDGRVRIAAVAAHLGCSRRHLSEQFRLATGLTPKQAARVARFEAARRLLLAPRRPALVDIATRCGYADQAHLARDWHALAGCSVGTWLLEEFPFVQDAAPRMTAESLA